MSMNKMINQMSSIFERSKMTGRDHAQIAKDIERTKHRLLTALGVGEEFLLSDQFIERKNEKIHEMLASVKNDYISSETSKQEGRKYSPIPFLDESILTKEDFEKIETRINEHSIKFNKKFKLDKWDYVIAGLCGLLAGVLDLMFISAPSKPSITPWGKEVSGEFNKLTQSWFNSIFTPEVTKKLEKFKIESADSTLVTDFLVKPEGSFRPINHRLLSLSHDPILGFIFGVLDMKNNTCTIIDNGTLKILPSTKKPVNYSIFQMIGHIFGHLLSDVNAPSNTGNRGMGLPAPFMGILRMFEFIPVGKSNFGKQIEYMYVNGYDFRQFMTGSIPLSILEVLVRSFYVTKQIKLYNAKFGETLVSTLPLKLKHNPRFRMIMTMAYGTMCTINIGKAYFTNNPLNLNYAALMGLTWNGIQTLRWEIYGKNTKFWDEFTESEYKLIMDTIDKIDDLDLRSQLLLQKNDSPTT